MKKGIYETTYGNACYVSGPGAKVAYDLDMAEPIPLDMVDPDKWVREAEDDEPAWDDGEAFDDVRVDDFLERLFEDDELE